MIPTKQDVLLKWLRKEFPYPRYIWRRCPTKYGYAYAGRPGGIALRVKISAKPNFTFDYPFFDAMLSTPTAEVLCYKKWRRQIVNLSHPRSLLNLKRIVKRAVEDPTWP